MDNTVKKLNELNKQLRELGPLLPGTLDSRENVCGKAGCRCKDKINPVKHGPYYRLCVGKTGARGTFFVTNEDAKAVGRMCSDYKKAKDLLSDISLATLELWREKGVNAVRVTVGNLVAMPESRSTATTIRKLTIARDKWKARALEGKAVLEKNRITIRDLTASRKQWSAKTRTAKKELATAKKDVERLKKELDCVKKKE